MTKKLSMVAFFTVKTGWLIAHKILLTQTWEQKRMGLLVEYLNCCYRSGIRAEICKKCGINLKKAKHKVY